jgi:predicted nucleic acid-binding protein
VIDSDVLIDISRDKAAAVDYVEALGAGWAISQISTLELTVGARDNRDLMSIDRFLSRYTVAPLRATTGAAAYELLKRFAKSHGLQVFDSLVAATAIEQGLTLISRNRKHFDMIRELDLLVPQY